VALRWRPGFGGPDPVLPEELQHCNSLDFAGLLNRCPATRSANSAATHSGAQRTESGQRDRDLWPGGNTAPETTMLSGYRVDTLQWADNVRGTGSRRGGCPGEFQRGLTRRGKGAASGWGTSATPLPKRAWPGTRSPVQFYTHHRLIRVSRTDDCARPRRSSCPARPGWLLSRCFSRPFRGFRRDFVVHPEWAW
jgi:hypothetical protein